MIVNKNIRKIFIVIVLFGLNYSIAIAKNVKWDDFTQPLKVNFEISGTFEESVEVSLPEDIISRYEKIPIYFEIHCNNCFDYARPYVKINNSNWAKYSINKDRLVYIKRKHLKPGINKLTLSNERMITVPTKYSEIRFKFDDIEKIREEYSIGKSNNSLVKNKSIDQKERIKWDNIKKPLETKFEIRAAQPEVIEVIFPEMIIQTFDYVYLNIDFDIKDIDSVSPYIQINENLWARYLINESKVIKIQTNDLVVGSNKFKFACKNSFSHKGYINALRFELKKTKEGELVSSTQNSKSKSTILNIDKDSKGYNKSKKQEYSSNKVSKSKKNSTIFPKIGGSFSFDDGIDGFAGSVNKNYKWIKRRMKWRSSPQDFKNENFEGFYLKEENDLLDNYVTYSMGHKGNYYSDLTDLKFYKNELFEIIQYNNCSSDKLISGNNIKTPSNRIPRTIKLIKKINKKLNSSRKNVGDKEKIWENDNVKIKLCDYSYNDSFSSMIIINYKPIKDVFDKEYNKRISETKSKRDYKALGKTFTYGVDGIICSQETSFNPKIYNFEWKTSISELRKQFSNFSFDSQDKYLENAEIWYTHGQANKYGDYSLLWFYNDELFYFETYFKESREELLDFQDDDQQAIEKLTEGQKLIKSIAKEMGDGVNNEDYTIWETKQNIEIILGKFQGDESKSVLTCSFLPISTAYFKKHEQAKLAYEKSQDNFEKKSRANVKQNSIKVKGLYIGMYYKDAISIIENIFATKVKIDKTNTNSANIYSVASIEWDNNGHIITISIQDTNSFFGMNRVKTKEFVQEFCNSYKIPNMKYYTTSIPYFGTYTGYKYESPKGFQIDITESHYYEGMTKKNINHLDVSKIAKKESGTFN